MAQSILIFDFGTNEEAAQQGRHKVDAWQQGFRLGKKILLKFDRKESNGSADAAATGDANETSAAKGKPAKKGSAKAKSASAGDGKTAAGVRLLIRLDFSDHERLTLQRWLDRIPSEEPFKSAKGETIRHGDASFAAAAELFESLD
jgi:hypothetical protein